MNVKKKNFKIKFIKLVENKLRLPCSSSDAFASSSTIFNLSQISSSSCRKLTVDMAGAFCARSSFSTASDDFGRIRYFCKITISDQSKAHF